MPTDIDVPRPPAMPLAPVEYNRVFINEHSNVLRLFFNRLSAAMLLVRDTSKAPEILRFQPIAEPSDPVAGEVYYDQSTNKLRCYNGTIWNDLF